MTKRLANPPPKRQRPAVGVSVEIPDRLLRRKNFRNLTGEKIGRLTVKSFAGMIMWGQQKHAHWNCVCDCGTECPEMAASHLIKKTPVVSCGCWLIEKSTKHGHNKNSERSPTLQSYSDMLKRITNRNTRAYKDYGGRGITICDRWLGDSGFANFLEDMGERPEEMTIERKNVNGNYCKDNCKWATDIEQANNKRTTKWIDYNGRRLALSVLAAEVNLPARVIYDRLRLGWSVPDAMETPVKQRPK